MNAQFISRLLTGNNLLLCLLQTLTHHMQVLKLVSDGLECLKV